MAEKDIDLYTSHSIDEARKHHGKKMQRLENSRKTEEELDALKKNKNKSDN